MKQGIKIIDLADPERIWLEEVYSKNQEGIKFSFKEIWSKLYKQLPKNFHPPAMDQRLIDAGGEQIKVQGVMAIEKNDVVLIKIDKVMVAIGEILLADANRKTILIQEIVNKTSIPYNDINLILHMVREFGDFYRGSSYEANSTILKSIDVEGSDKIFYEYIQYPGIEQLIALKSYESFHRPDEEFSLEEMIISSDKIDFILEEIKTLKLGQEIIWTDLMNELNELKALYSLSKRNWRQLLAGKLGEMIAAGIIGETVSKKIAEFINPVINNLLN
jgi:hypothetical protein